MHLEYAHQDVFDGRMRASVSFQGENTTIEGTLKPALLIVDGRVLVKLANVRPPVGERGLSSVWVAADDLLSTETTKRNETAPSFILRSAVIELPQGANRDYALRTFSLTLSEFVTAYGLSVSLAPNVADMHELSVVIDVPVKEGTDYLWRFRQSIRLCHDEPTAWSAPAAPFAERRLEQKERKVAGHNIGQLPLWLTTRRFWSAFRWQSGRLEHVLRFSMETKLQRTLIRRFGMK